MAKILFRGGKKKKQILEGGVQKKMGERGKGGGKGPMRGLELIMGE